MAENSTHKDATDKAGASWFKMFAKYVTGQITSGIPGALRNSMSVLAEDLPSAEDMKFIDWVNKMNEDGVIDDSVAKMLNNQVQELPDFAGLIAFWLRIQVVMTSIESMMQVTSQSDQYNLLSQSQPHPADKDSLIRAMIIDPGRAKENKNQLKRLGYNDDQITNLVLAYYQTYDEGTIRDLYLRGEIGNDKMYERMRELGYTDTRIGEISKTWALIPPPQDLVRFAYRALFSQETRNRWPWMFNPPPGFPEWMEKHGYSKSWAEMYWAAHWQQPGLQQTFEMLHRDDPDNPGQKIISLDDVKYALEARGFSEFWQEKLTKISYNPYTRVDVRRMHDLGVLSTDDLVKAYEDLGYNSERAINMAKFTVRYNQKGGSDLTRATITNSYRDGLLSRENAMTLLTDQGYSRDAADFYLTLEDYEKEKYYQDLYIENIRERFLQNQLSRQQASEQLYGLDLPSREVDAMLTNWELRRYKYERIPTLTDLTEFLNRGLIDEPTFNRFMRQHGYDSESINLYLKAIRSPQQRTGRTPSRTDLEKFFLSGIIDKQTWWDEMKIQGYEEKYIEWYFRMLTQQPK